MVPASLSKTGGPIGLSTNIPTPISPSQQSGHTRTITYQQTDTKLNTKHSMLPLNIVREGASEKSFIETLRERDNMFLWSVVI